MKTRPNSPPNSVSNRSLFFLPCLPIFYFCLGAAYAGPPKDPATFAILGLHLGLRPDEVATIVKKNIADADGEEIRSELVMGQFSLPNVLFGYRVKQGKDSYWNNVSPNTDSIQINYTLTPDPVVMYITRTRVFDDGTAPPIAALARSISEKYGTPAGEEGGGTQRLRMFWVTAPVPRHDPNPALWAHSCGWDLSSFGSDPFRQMRDGNVNYNPDYINEIYPRCGISMMVDIEPLFTNTLLARSVTISVGDFRALQASDVYILEVLHKGATDKANADAQKAAANKTPL